MVEREGLTKEMTAVCPEGQLYLPGLSRLSAPLQASTEVLAKVVYDDSLGPPNGVCPCCGLDAYDCDELVYQEELFP